MGSGPMLLAARELLSVDPAESVKLHRPVFSSECILKLDYTEVSFFTMRVVRHWPMLPREAVVAPPWKCSRPGWMEL